MAFEPDDDQCFNPTPTDFEFMAMDMMMPNGLQTTLAVIQVKTSSSISRYFFEPDNLVKFGKTCVEVGEQTKEKRASSLIVPSLQMPPGFDPKGNGG